MKPSPSVIAISLLSLWLTGCGVPAGIADARQERLLEQQRRELRQQHANAEREAKTQKEAEQRRITAEKQAAEEKAALIALYRKNKDLRVLEIEKTCVSRIDPSAALQARTLQDLFAVSQCLYRSEREATVTVAYSPAWQLESTTLQCLRPSTYITR